jgi:hypothetical protein
MAKWLVAWCVVLTACTDDVDPFEDGFVTRQECVDADAQPTSGPNSRPETCSGGVEPLALIIDGGAEGSICCAK